LNELTVHAPAKINLALKILRKRADGYHDIQSILQKVSIYDTLSFKRSPHQGITVAADDPSIPTDSRNLAYRAADLLLKQQKITPGISIHIKKRIPAGAGLGGGSSNAAATLAGLNKLLRCNLTEADLLRMGVEIGADVPFFIYNQPSALAEGIGEQLSPVKIHVPLWLVIVFPGFSISTKWVYENYRVLTNERKNIRIPRSFKQLNTVLHILSNDLEHVVTQQYPEIQKIKRTLIQTGACGSLMSGSGSSVFGIFPDEHHAQEALTLLSTPANRVFIAHSL
jgi:4-diphosphocytidyl-2-C-methyl-D-erythritol kinase